MARKSLSIEYAVDFGLEDRHNISSLGTGSMTSVNFSAGSRFLRSPITLSFERVPFSSPAMRNPVLDCEIEWITSAARCTVCLTKAARSLICINWSGGPAESRPAGRGVLLEPGQHIGA
jgi:hypothetical protein